MWDDEMVRSDVRCWVVPCMCHDLVSGSHNVSMCGRGSMPNEDIFSEVAL